MNTINIARYIDCFTQSEYKGRRIAENDFSICMILGPEQVISIRAQKKTNILFYNTQLVNSNRISEDRSMKEKSPFSNFQYQLIAIFHPQKSFNTKKSKLNL